MSDTAYDRLSALGISLPDAPAPAANYVPYIQTGHLLFHIWPSANEMVLSKSQARLAQMSSIEPRKSKRVFALSISLPKPMRPQAVIYHALKDSEIRRVCCLHR